MLAQIVKVTCECGRSALLPVATGVPFPTLCPRCDMIEAREYADLNPHLADASPLAPSYPPAWEDVEWS